MGVKPIQSLDEFNKIINGDKVAIFDFWAAWCGPCRTISPIFEGLSEQFDSIEFYKVDVDSAEDISREVHIRAMPTFIAFKEGKELAKVVGANPGALKELIVAHA